MPAPTITKQPVSITVAPGSDATFSVTASGAKVYRWQFNGMTILDAPSGGGGGAGTPTLTMSNVGKQMDGGKFRCLLESPDNVIIYSNEVVLTVSDDVPRDAPTVTGTGKVVYGTDPGAPAASATAPGAAGVALDGNWSSILPCGAPLVTYPFLSESGDNRTKIVRQPVQGDVRARGGLPPGTAYNYAAPWNAFYNGMHGDTISFDESEPRDLGGNLGEWIRSYASIPRTRVVPESFIYNFQYYVIQSSASSNQGGSDGGGSGSSSTTVSLRALPRKVGSRLFYEYFLAADADTFPVLRRPQIVDTGGSLIKMGDGVLQASNKGTVFVSTDGPKFIAEDSDIKVWHWPIMVRITRYIDAPTDEFWGSSIELPTIEPSA